MVMLFLIGVYVCGMALCTAIVAHALWKDLPDDNDKPSWEDWTMSVIAAMVWPAVLLGMGVIVLAQRMYRKMYNAPSEQGGG